MFDIGRNVSSNQKGKHSLWGVLYKYYFVYRDAFDFQIPIVDDEIKKAAGDIKEDGEYC